MLLIFHSNHSIFNVFIFIFSIYIFVKDNKYKRNIFTETTNNAFKQADPTF